ncbi:MAG: polysulfide reductase NrfD [Thermoleophilaceae bacterium]|nr:polysulfide reductase NrfD [Thermoleophilaceae bacterium]
MVPRAEPRSYYGRPVIKEPVWTWQIPIYLFSGGLGGASAGLAYLAERAGNDELARNAWAVSLGGMAVSPLMLISDLGRPLRFLNMLRVLKVTSPMSVGSWLLAATGGAVAAAAADAWMGRLPRLSRGARPAAALAGMPLSTYTGALLASTAVPVWGEARRELPFVFAGGAAASAGAAATALTSARNAGPARRLALLGAAAELAATRAMERRLGALAEPYRRGAAGALSRLATALTAGGAGLLAGGGRRSRGAPALAGAGMIVAGALAERWAIFRAGFQSAADPGYTVGPQRERVRRGESEGAERRAPARGTQAYPAAGSQ